MQTDFDDLLNRVTHSLRFDPELQLEIQRELRAHLRDSEAQYRAAGLSETEAAAKAAQALGDERELNDQLWQTHRWRMKFRSIVRWLATLLLAPAALIITILIMISVLRDASPIALSLASREGNNDAAISFFTAQSKKLLPPLTPDEQQILPANVALGFPVADFLSPAEAACKAHPRDLDLLANYAANYLAAYLLDGSFADQAHPLFSSAQLATAMHILHQGETLDPDNAFFPLLEAQCLVRASSRLVFDVPGNYFPWSSIDYQGHPYSQNCLKLQIVHPELLSQGIAVFQKAAAMSRFDDYFAQLLQRRLKLLSSASSVGNQVLRMNTAVFSQSFAQMECSDLLMSLSAHSVELASAGQQTQALQLAIDIQRAGSLLNHSDAEVIETSWSSAIYPIIAAHAAAVLQLAGRQVQAEDLRRWILQQSARDRGVFRIFHERSGTFFDIVSERYGHRFAVDKTPALRAEYALYDQAGLVVVVVFLLLAAGASAAGAMFEAIAAGKRPAAAMLFLPRPREWGWLFAIALSPIALYVAYVHFVPAGQRFYGLETRAKIANVEYAIVSFSVLFASIMASAQIARHRLISIGGDRQWLTSFGPAATVFVTVLATLTFCLPAAIMFCSSSSRTDDILRVMVPISLILFLIALVIALRVRGLTPSLSQSRLIAICGRVAVIVSAIVTVIALVMPLLFVIPSDDSQNVYTMTFSISFGLVIAMVPLYLAIRLRQQRSNNTAATPRLRAAGSILRSISLMTATLALVIAFVGGIALHAAESIAVGQIQRGPILAQLSIETDPDVQNLRQSLVCRSDLIASQCEEALQNLSRPQ